MKTKFANLMKTALIIGEIIRRFFHIHNWKYESSKESTVWKRYGRYITWINYRCKCGAKSSSISGGF